MDFRVSVRELDPPRCVQVVCDGVSARGDVALLEVAAADVRVQGAARIVLDFRSLGSISPHAVKAVIAWQRELTDRNASLVCLGANSVIRWRLARARGPLPLPEAETLDEARDLPLGRLPDMDVGARTFALDAAEAILPDLGIVADLDAVLDGQIGAGDASPAVSAALQRAGLAESAVLVPLRHGRLRPKGATTTVDAGGLLARTLVAAESALAPADLDRSELCVEELALLSWSRADLLLPLREGGRLQGLMAVRTGRVGGLAAYRSGEMMALELLGRWLAHRMASVPVPQSTAAGDPAREVADLVEAVSLTAV